MRQQAESGERIAEGDLSPENMIGLIEAEAMVKANAVVLRSADELLGSLLDVKV